MFTGIIQHLGTHRGYDAGTKELRVESAPLAGRVALGGSLAVDGVCLSVVRVQGPLLVFNVSEETRGRTTLGALPPGAVLNLESPLTLADPLGGHLVSGHVDFTTRLRRIQARPLGRRLQFALAAAFRPFLIPKGSVAVNGVSLTVAALSTAAFEVEVIPVTLQKSNLAGLRAGQMVNVECDMIGKYIYNWMKQRRV